MGGLQVLERLAIIEINICCRLHFLRIIIFLHATTFCCHPDLLRTIGKGPWHSRGYICAAGIFLAHEAHLRPLQLLNPIILHIIVIGAFTSLSGDVLALAA